MTAATDPRGGVLFLVPARAGSLRIPGKNLREVAGIPLVGHAVRLARAAAALVPGGPHAVVCSTDDPATADCARSWGAQVPFLRPRELATASASSVDVALHALDALAAGGRQFRALVLLQPTSPLSEATDIAAAVRRHDDDAQHRPVAAVADSHPAGWHVSGVPEGLVHAAGTAAHLLTGSCYVISPDELAVDRAFVVDGRTQGLVVPRARAVDVDVEEDLALAEALAGVRPVRAFAVGDRVVGSGACLVIAEAGVNHDGDVGLAHRLVDAAADAGVDAVKFQTFSPDLLASAEAPTAVYQRAATAAGESQRAMLARLALPEHAWRELREHAVERGLVFLSTPFDEPSALLLDELGVPALKVGSGELTNHPFLARLAALGRPLLLSTGMADMLEVAAALDVVARHGDVPVALLHCVSSYPASPADANLRAIDTMRAAFGVPVGWSCHMTGTDVALAAAARGADVLEKHLTLDRSMPGPDHAASLEPAELAELVRGVRTVSSALGSGRKVPVAAETDVSQVARRSLHWTQDLPAGTTVDAGHLSALRPGTGVAPSEQPWLVGRPLRRPVTAGAMVDLADLGDHDEGAR